MATLIFEISWSPLVAAQLASLLDNGHEMLAAPHTEDDGRITLQWEANPLVPHTLVWDLFAAGQDLTDLKAVAAWAHGKVQPLADEDGPTDRWTGSGIVRRKAVTP